MNRSKLTVHLYSFIAKADVWLKQAMPSINIKKIEFPEDASYIFSKKVTENEIQQLQDARILIADAYLLSQIYRRLPKVEWVQLTYSGVDTLTSVVQNSVKPTFPVTRLGAAAQSVKEYVIGWIINHERQYLRIPEMEVERGWYKLDMVNFRTLDQLTIGVMGVGAIGSSIVALLKAAGCKVNGLGRSHEPTTSVPMDAYWNTKDLDQFLSQCDYIINTLPSTDETKHLLGYGRLAAAKKKPVLMNVGRGDIISEVDVIKALNNGWISHAILDVYEEEPLPKNSCLWDHAQVTLTPHVAAFSKGSDVVPTFIENLRRFQSKQPLLYLVDFDKKY